MFNEFEKLKNNLASINEKDIESLDEVIGEIDINDNNFDDWINNIFSERIYELNIAVVPQFLDCLYKTTDKYKFMMFCMMLEALCNDLPFITNLENYPLFKEKYLMLKPTLIEVSSKVDNGIADCMYLIMINNDPRGEFLEEEEKTALISSINMKLKNLYEFLTTSNEVPEEAYYALEVLLDISVYINDEITKEYVDKIASLKLNQSTTLFLLKFQANNAIPLTEDKLNNVLISGDGYLYRLLKIFEAQNNTSLLPMSKINQEMVAKSCLIDWLKYPTELGKTPDEIELVDAYERDDSIYYIYKFKSDVFADRGYMLGVAGGFKKGVISSYNSGHTFSFFETITDAYLSQANKIVDTIIEHWQKRANEMNE